MILTKTRKVEYHQVFYISEAHLCSAFRSREKTRTILLIKIMKDPTDDEVERFPRSLYAVEHLTRMCVYKLKPNLSRQITQKHPRPNSTADYTRPATDCKRRCNYIDDVNFKTQSRVGTRDNCKNWSQSLQFRT